MSDLREGSRLASFALAAMFVSGCTSQEGTPVPVQTRTAMSQQQPLETRIQTIMGNPHLSDSQKQAIIAKMKAKSGGSSGPQ